MGRGDGGHIWVSSLRSPTTNQWPESLPWGGSCSPLAISVCTPCPAFSSIFRLASLPASPTSAPDLTSHLPVRGPLLTLKGSCLLIQGRGGELGWSSGQHCLTTCFSINHYFRVPFRVPARNLTDEEPGGARASHLIPLKPERTLGIFHAWAWGWWSAEHLVCPTYRVCKAWDSWFLNAVMFICTVALVEFPVLMMLLSYLGSLLEIPEWLVPWSDELEPRNLFSTMQLGWIWGSRCT